MPRRNYPTQTEWKYMIKNVLADVNPPLEETQIEDITAKLLSQLDSAGYQHAETKPSNFENQMELDFE